MGPFKSPGYKLKTKHNLNISNSLQSEHWLKKFSQDLKWIIQATGNKNKLFYHLLY